jgi:6-phosphogluconolactonase
MRFLLATILFAVSTMTLHADTYVYVSLAPEQTIQVFRLDPADGSLTPVDKLAVDGAPGALCVSPDKRTLFASLRTTFKLASCQLDPATGKLTLRSTAALPKDENAAYVATDRSGKWLLSASYQAGKIVVHAVADGKIQEPAGQTVATTQTAHCTVVDRDNRLVFVPHVAPNAIYQFRFDAASGQLSEAGKAPGGTPKAGPRHLAFHPTRDFAFSSDEQASSITSYRYTAGSGLAPLQTLSTLPADFSGKNTTAEVKVHPGGNFAWVSNRGHDSLAGFALDGSAKLRSLGQTPTEKTPRSFDIEPDGRYLLAAGEGSGKLAVYAVDAASGALTRRHTYDVGKSLTWVMAVKH